MSFSRPYWLLLSAGLGFFVATHFGWRAVTASAVLEETGSMKPRGQGWLHIAAAPAPYRVTNPGTAVDLWWNPAQAVIAGVAGFVSVLVLLWVFFALIRTGLRVGHRPQYREEGRMTAALHYSVAWSVPLLLAALLLLPRALARIGAIKRWLWYPAQSAVDFVACVIGAIALILWWFWLFRLVSTAPADSRGRLAWFVGLGVPIIVAGGVAAWWLGLSSALTNLFDWWKLAF
jgi:hypothetical protein